MSDKRIHSGETAGLPGDLVDARARPPAKADPYPPGLGPKKLEPLADEVPRAHPMLRGFPDHIGVADVYLFTLERVGVEQIIAKNIDTRDCNPFVDAFANVVTTLTGSPTRQAGPREYLSMTRRLRVTWLLVAPDGSLRSSFDESIELGTHTFGADGSPNDVDGWGKLVAQLVDASRREAADYVRDLIVKGSTVGR